MPVQGVPVNRRGVSTQINSFHHAPRLPVERALGFPHGFHQAAPRPFVDIFHFAALP